MDPLTMQWVKSLFISWCFVIEVFKTAFWCEGHTSLCFCFHFHSTCRWFEVNVVMGSVRFPHSLWYLSYLIGCVREHKSFMLSVIGFWHRSYLSASCVSFSPPRLSPVISSNISARVNVNRKSRTSLTDHFIILFCSRNRGKLQNVIAITTAGAKIIS